VDVAVMLLPHIEVPSPAAAEVAAGDQEETAADEQRDRRALEQRPRGLQGADRVVGVVEFHGGGASAGGIRREGRPSYARCSFTFQASRGRSTIPDALERAVRAR